MDTVPQFSSRDAQGLRIERAIYVIFFALLCLPMLFTSAKAATKDDFEAAVADGQSVTRPVCPTNSDNRSNTTDMYGFATAGLGTNGGANNPALYVVNTVADPAGPPGTLSLRQARDLAAANSDGAWILFSSSIAGQTINLTSTLLIPSNTTIDGGCRGITISNVINCNGQMICVIENCDSCSRTLFQISDNQNIIIMNLTFQPDVGPSPGYIFAMTDQHDTPPNADFKSAESGDCITIDKKTPSLETTQIWIAHNTFLSCHDDLLDIVQNHQDPVNISGTDGLNHPMNITIAFNLFQNHDKDMGFSSGTCSGSPPLDYGSWCTLPIVSPSVTYNQDHGLHVTLQGNLFYETGARHPRVSGLTFVHMVDNVIGYEKAVFPAAEWCTDPGQGCPTTGIAVLTGGPPITKQTLGTEIYTGARVYGKNNLWAALDGFSTSPPAVKLTDTSTEHAADHIIQTTTYLLPTGPSPTQPPADLVVNWTSVGQPGLYVEGSPKLGFSTNLWAAVTCLSAHVGSGSSFQPITEPYGCNL